VVGYEQQYTGRIMEDNTIAVVMVLIAIYLCARTSGYWTKHQEVAWLTAIKMLIAANNAADELAHWEEARPALNHGRCPYARYRVMQQIYALEYLAEHGYRTDLEHFEHINRLRELIGQPPDYDPPLADFLLNNKFFVSESAQFVFNVFVTPPS